MALPRCDTWPHAVKTPIRNPPFDPSPDGPAPAPGSSSSKDHGYVGWMEKCVEKSCEASEGWCENRICKFIKRWACKRAGTNHSCCDCVRHTCVSEKASEIPDENLRHTYCMTNFFLCMANR